MEYVKCEKEHKDFIVPKNVFDHFDHSSAVIAKSLTKYCVPAVSKSAYILNLAKLPPQAQHTTFLKVHCTI